MSEQTNEGEHQTSDEPSSDTAPEQKEKVTFNEDQQAVSDKVALQGRDNVRSERQKTADLQRQLEEAQAKIPKETRPTVNEAGETFEEDYEANRNKRETQIRAQATFDARAEWDAEAAQTAQLAQQQTQQLAYQDSVTKFNGTAQTFGIDQNQLAVMGQTIASYGGLTPDVSSFVINDEQGMLIYQHMAANPLDIQTVNNMTPMQAGVFLESVKTKQAALNTKKTSDTPDPPDRLDGGGVDTDAGKYPYSKGAVFT